MATTETQATTEFFADPGEQCRGCKALLATDQRYCLSCGLRRAEARLPFKDILRDQGAAMARPLAGASPAAPPPGRNPWIVGIAMGGAAALLLGLGVLIGDGGKEQKAPVISQKAPVVNVSVPAGGGAAPVAAATIAEDWPSGTAGYTVKFSTLPKTGTQQAQVDSAKSDAEGKGASDVGVINSDNHSSLDAGEYVIYSGVFEGKKGKKSAAKALKKLKKDFPAAAVVQVSASGDSSAGGGGADPFSGKKKKEATVSRDALKKLQSTSGGDQQKKSAKLPDKTKIPGAAPPKDKKKPGGGSGGGEVIQ